MADAPRTEVEENLIVDDDVEIIGDIAAADRGLMDIMPQLYRWVPATVAAGVTKNPHAIAAAAGAGEFGYQTYMDFLAGEDLSLNLKNAHTHLENLYEGGKQAAWSYFGSALAPLSQRLVRETGRIGWAPLRYGLNQKPLPGEVLSAESALGRATLGDEVYTLSLAQRYGDEVSWAQTLESWGRSALIGKGRFKLLDKTNRAALLRLVDADLATKARSLSTTEFAAELGQAITNQKSFRAGALRWLYGSYREYADELVSQGRMKPGFGYNFEKLKKFFGKYGVTGKSGEGLDAASDVYKEVDDLLRLHNFADKKGIAAKTWETADADFMLQLRARLNELTYEYKAPPRFSRIYKEATQAVRDSMKTGTKELDDLLTIADNFLQDTSIDSKILQRWLNKLAENPERAVTLLRSSPDRLALVKQLRHHFRDISIDLPTGGTMRGTALGDKAFEETVLKPLRHSIIAESQFDGKVIGMKLKNTLRTLGDDFLNNVFTPEEVTNWHDIANALSIIEQTRYGDKIFIQLVQGGALTHFGLQLARGGGGAGMTRAGSAISITMLPYALARLMSNPTRLKSITQGLIAGPNTTKFNRALHQMIMLNKETQKKLEAMTMEQLGFYNMYDNKGIITGSDPDTAANPQLAEF